MKRPKPSRPLARVRKARMLSQQDFSGLLGVSQQTVSKYERGVLVPPRDLQALMAAILGVGVETLFTDGEPDAATTERLA